MVDFEKLADRYLSYLSDPWKPDPIVGDEAFEIACKVDALSLLYTSQDYWKYVLPRFINFDWRDNPPWKQEPTSKPKTSS